MRQSTISSNQRVRHMAENNPTCRCFSASQTVEPQATLSHQITQPSRLSLLPKKNTKNTHPGGVVVLKLLRFRARNLRPERTKREKTDRNLDPTPPGLKVGREPATRLQGADPRLQLVLQASKNGPVQWPVRDGSVEVRKTAGLRSHGESGLCSESKL